MRLGAVARALVAPVGAVAAVVGFIALLLFVNASPVPRGGPTVAGPPPAAPVTQPPAASPTASPVASRSASPAEPAVTVLNDSRRSGLARAVARQLAAAGWPIARVGNFPGRIPVTTAYYAPHQRAAAHRLARRFGHIVRVLPRFAGLPGRGLTVVVTREYPAPRGL